MSYELGPRGASYPAADLSTVDIDWSMVDLSPGARVNRGMLYLLRTYGQVALGMDAHTLDIEDIHDCPLGQIHGNYNLAPEVGDWSSQRLFAHGFKLGERDIYSADLHMYPISAMWRMAITVWQSKDFVGHDRISIPGAPDVEP